MPGLEQVRLPQADTFPPAPMLESGPSSADKQKIADEIASAHRKGLKSARPHNLTAEKYLLHIDGEGGSQWADIYEGERVEIPRSLASAPQENLLRIVVANAVAYHTTMPFRFTADHNGDRSSREQAKLDSLVVNHVIDRQNLNAVAAQAMFLAMPYGSCPIHVFWRDDITSDPYVSPWNPDVKGPQKGLIDLVCGDPWDTVYNNGATRNSVNWVSYGRTFPADMIRRRFNMPDLKGSKTMPSSARVQRIGRKWMQGTVGSSGSFVAVGSDNEELIAVICREIAPGIDADFPDGRLSVIALDGSASTDREDGGSLGRAVLLHDGPLPAKKFSMVRVYSHDRFDDVKGKPFVGDIDDQQVLLNTLLLRRMEYIRRATRAPLIEYGGIEEDFLSWEDDAILHANPTAVNGQRPFFLETPSAQIQVLNVAIEDCRTAIFRIGGYQANSRGESQPGQAAASVVALQSADDTIHGPIHQRFTESMCGLAALCWANFREYADVPWVISVAGDEYADMAESYIDKNKLSDTEPNFRLITGFGATPESRAQQLMNLVSAKGADGEPLLKTKQFHKLWPDDTMGDEDVDPNAIRAKRALTINGRIRTVCENADAQLRSVTPQMKQQASQVYAQRIFQQIMAQYPVLPDDNAQLHYDALSDITQDETESPIARSVAGQRQAQYRAVLQQQAPQPGGVQQPAPQSAPRPIAGQQQGAGHMDQLQSQVHQLTDRAKAMAQ